jgi:NMD protein affecting ribosome stability and mRNA decay
MSDEKKSVFRSLCMECVWKTQPIMLTGYCLTGLRCDGCGKVTDLALTKERTYEWKPQLVS